MSSSSQDVIVYFNGTFMQKLNGAHARMDSFLRFLLRHFERVIERRIMSRILDQEEHRRAAVHESRAYFASIGQRGDHEELLGLLGSRQAAPQGEIRDAKAQREEGIVCLTKSPQDSSARITI
jgi:hypothetical protein